MSAALPEQWRLLAPADTVVIDIARGPEGRRRAVAAVRGLDAGSAVALRGTRSALARVAQAGGVDVRRELIPLPSLAHPLYLVEDDAASAHHLIAHLLSVPPGVSWLAGPLDFAMRVSSRAARLQWVRRLFPWRIAMGVRL